MGFDQERTADYESAGFASRVGAGSAPAVIVIDVCRAYLADGPFSDTGGRFEAARASAERIVEAARRADVPVLFTRVMLSPDLADAGWFAKKVPGLRAFAEGSPYIDYPEAPRPRDGEVVITKQYASAFFGTSLAATLNAKGIDTTISLGFSTSGCVRATALDATQYGFRSLVAREACGDRDEAVHEANLFDLDAKYADVMSEADIISLF